MGAWQILLELAVGSEDSLKGMGRKAQTEERVNRNSGSYVVTTGGDHVTAKGQCWSTGAGTLGKHHDGS